MQHFIKVDNERDLLICEKAWQILKILWCKQYHGFMIVFVTSVDKSNTTITLSWSINQAGICVKKI